MNHQGWPCSKGVPGDRCKGSQFGRGGTFFGVANSALHESSKGLLKLVCACDGGSLASRRFCNFGCFRKNTTGWSPAAPLAQQAVSAWDAIAWTGEVP